MLLANVEIRAVFLYATDPAKEPTYVVLAVYYIRETVLCKIVRS